MDDDLQENINVLLNDCDYIDCADLQRNVGGNFDILHVNARSLNNNFDDLVLLLSCL